VTGYREAAPAPVLDLTIERAQRLDLNAATFASGQVPLKVKEVGEEHLTVEVARE
jgi:hypothetical protein